MIILQISSCFRRFSKTGEAPCGNPGVITIDEIVVVNVLCMHDVYLVEFREFILRHWRTDVRAVLSNQDDDVKPPAENM